MGGKIEAAKLELDTEKENDEIKYDNMKTNDSLDMKISATTSNRISSYYKHTKSNLMKWTLLNPSKK